MDHTRCYSYFSICSSGDVLPGQGFIAAENSDFEPDYITEKLGIRPYETRKKGTPRKSFPGLVMKEDNLTYPFSDWCACKQNEPALDALEQCLQIVRMLRDKIPLLQEIKQDLSVDFAIVVVPEIYIGETPLLGINREIIEFCYLTGTEIDIDMYVYANSNEEGS